MACAPPKSEASKGQVACCRAGVQDEGATRCKFDIRSAVGAARHPARRSQARRLSRTGKPEPILTGDDYEHILSVLENMVGVMEQSPGAFREIDEESLRTHFLVQLNGHFAGDATGETFNYEGKSDILIEVDGKNIFVGECSSGQAKRDILKPSTKSYHT
ncbi:hypothetical protein NOJ28_04110 [Neorhizobium galegae]|uniref:hypothetical protein n=1 Tax=Neorhizobium galegae TaxID=399 RepID=UPI002104AF36|nr:hypothetical protein [Neorhizobium galegae]MCQ1764707.1 hypothetical protein [Neorhizobium galegae]MCQ1849278.1 hypothetical protein [Neorhizobium galegae]